MNTSFTQQLEKIEHALHTAFSRVPAESNVRAGENHTPVHNTDAFTLLSAPCANLLSGGGKRWRPLLMLLAYTFAGGTDEHIYTLAPLIEGIHTASLIHDDIEDNSELRRGKPAAHIVYGLDSALNAGSWLYFQALKSIEVYQAPADIKLDLYAAALTQIQALHKGQALDIHWHRTPGFFPSRQDYERMIKLKTGALAVLAVYTGMRAAGKAHAEAAAFSSVFADSGVGFQIIDDVKNITIGNAGKKRGDDIVEGKKSLPVILHIEKYPDDAPLLTALFTQAQQEGSDSPAVERAITLLSNATAEAQRYGKAAVSAVGNRLSAEYGSRAIEAFNSLFELMQIG
ncbi:polyprenyl synthetase family protein [Treponema sp.]|uniref:polyprenyl synthetase family protein n=1 Tax=Treponema sp. TaxID=166 RepID=UPI003FA2D96A